MHQNEPYLCHQNCNDHSPTYFWLFCCAFVDFWPSLLDVPGFLQQFITPIVKVTKGKKSVQFFTLPEYEHWLESTGNNGKGYNIKYYKGLGTSTSAEAKEYFSNLDLHEVHFDLLSNDIVRKDDMADDDLAPVLPDNVHSGSDMIDMVFRKERVEDRKMWLSHVRKNVFVDFRKIAVDGLRYSDFINKELILFSHYDNDRSIPHLVDGLKPSQRKVLYGCFKRKLYKNEIKVAQLVGYVAEHSAYHHGEASLQGTIVNMAQNFVGSNNVNLLTPSGQFGTRRMGGGDAASARYIFTKLEPIARTIFHPDDDELLNYLNDDGSTIEPEFYVPVIPLALCNGAEGIGTGWSSKIANYSPREIIANLRRKIASVELVPMAPFYCGFTGLIEEEKKGKYIVHGKIERVDETNLLITELPIKKWTQNYKEFLEGMLTGDGKTPPEIKDMKENHTETTVSFTVVAEKEKIDEWEKDAKGGLNNKFKLTASISTTNMTLFDEEARIIRYDTPEDIVNAFYTIRIDYYNKRKANLVKNLESEKNVLSNKARFVEEVCSGELIVNNRKRKDILEELQKRGYDLVHKDSTSKKTDQALQDGTDESDNEADETPTGDLAKGYEYLLGMKIWSLTYEKAEQLRAQFEQKSTELEILLATEPTMIWLRDLDAVEVALDERDAALHAAEMDERKAQKKNNTRVANKKSAAKKKNANERVIETDYDSDDDKMETGSESDNDFVVTKQKSNPAKAPIARPVKKSAPVIKSVVVPVLLPPSPKFKKAPALDLSDSSDDDLGESLMARMQKKLVVSPPPKPLREYNKKRPSPRMDDGFNSESDACFADDDVKPKPTKAAKKPAAKSKVTGSVSLTKKMNDTKKVALKTSIRKKMVDSDSDDDLDFPPDDEKVSSFIAPSSRVRPARSAVTKTTVVYALGSDDDSDAEFS
jgi:DNA topoisomerase II